MSTFIPKAHLLCNEPQLQCSPLDRVSQHVQRRLHIILRLPQCLSSQRFVVAQQAQLSQALLVNVLAASCLAVLLALTQPLTLPLALDTPLL